MHYWYKHGTLQSEFNAVKLPGRLPFSFLQQPSTMHLRRTEFSRGFVLHDNVVSTLVTIGTTRRFSWSPAKHAVTAPRPHPTYTQKQQHFHQLYAQGHDLPARAHCLFATVFKPDPGLTSPPILYIPSKQPDCKALFTRNYSKETERLRESPNSSLGDSWWFSTSSAIWKTPLNYIAGVSQATVWWLA
jgi:hypothetical protein